MGVHLALLPHIFSVQLNLEHVTSGVSGGEFLIKSNKPNPSPNSNL